MKIHALLNQVAAALDTWAVSRGGRAFIAGDPLSVFNHLGDKPGGVRVGVLFAGDVKRGELEEAGVMDRSFLIVISRGKGFTINAADSLTKGAGGGLPLFQLVEEARDVVRAIAFPEGTTEGTADFKGSQAYQFASDALVDAYQLEFSLACQMDAVAGLNFGGAQTFGNTVETFA